MNYKGQGALEYLLLLVAAMFVVAIVFVFINSTLGPTQTAGSEQTYNFLCSTLDGNTSDCACYNNNINNYYANTPDGDLALKNYCCSAKDSFLTTKYKEANGGDDACN